MASFAKIQTVINTTRNYGDFDKISEAFDKMSEVTDALETDMNYLLKKKEKMMIILKKKLKC